MEPIISTNRQSWHHYITVEPAMFLYMLAFQLTSVIEQQLFVRKACMINHNYTADICDNLKDHEDISKEVQITVSTFLQWHHIAEKFFPIVISLFIGAWSDKRGRKIPLLIGLAGKLIYVLALLVNIHYYEWPVQYIIFTATIPCALTGADISIFAAAFAYISDVSSIENRTTRVTVLEVCYLVTIPIGIALGSYMFYNVVDRSYFTMFSINATILVVAILYSIFHLKMRTSADQKPISEVGCSGIVGDFFDKQHVVDTTKTLCKKRTNHRRMFLWILLIAMFFYTFQRDERNYLFLYTTYKFGWEIKQFSNFKTFQSAAQNVMLIFGLPILTKLLKWKDTSIAMCGAIFFALARIVFTFAKVPELYYAGAAISSVGPFGGPVLRSMTSKVVPISERGKVFAMLAVCDNAGPLISSVLYTQVYQWTMEKFPGIFILTATTQMVLFFLIFTVHITLRGQPMTADEIVPTNEHVYKANSIERASNSNESVQTQMIETD